MTKEPGSSRVVEDQVGRRSLEEDLSTEREMELESIAFSTHPPFVSNDLTTPSHFTRIFNKQYPSQLEVLG